MYGDCVHHTTEQNKSVNQFIEKTNSANTEKKLGQYESIFSILAAFVFGMTRSDLAIQILLL